MNTLRIPSTDLDVSVIAYGASRFGTEAIGDVAARLYDDFRTAGGNFFDTAHCYAFWAPGGLGASERTLGELVRRRGDEGRVVIATKGCHPDAGADYRRPDRYISPEVLARDVADSLDRLGLPSVDVYFLHRDDRRVAVGEIIDALNEHVRTGRLKHLGASNWTPERIAAANAYAASRGLRGFVISQPRFSLAESNKPASDDDLATRPFDGTAHAWHTATGLPVMAYSSTGCGFFATDGRAGGATFDNPVSRHRLARVKQLAAQTGHTPTQLALAWLLHQPFPVVPILGTTNPSHLHDALGAVDVSLTRQQVEWLAS
jgi:aryl-alcohol dehydrogenase-like predicted oxidoreductase